MYELHDFYGNLMTPFTGKAISSSYADETYLPVAYDDLDSGSAAKPIAEQLLDMEIYFQQQQKPQNGSIRLHTAGLPDSAQPFVLVRQCLPEHAAGDTVGKNDDLYKSMIGGRNQTG